MIKIAKEFQINIYFAPSVNPQIKCKCKGQSATEVLKYYIDYEPSLSGKYRVGRYSKDSKVYAKVVELKPTQNSFIYKAVKEIYFSLKPL